EPPLQVPRLGQAVVVAELLAGAQRLADVVLEALVLTAQDAERAEAEQRARRRGAGERKRVLEHGRALRAVPAGRPEAPERGRQPEQQVVVTRLLGPVDGGPKVRVVGVEQVEERRLVAGA